MITHVYLFGTGQAATSAGNKPPIIITVEKLIWNAIFAVARGNIDLLKAIKTLAESFPWLEVETETQNDWVRHWFNGIPNWKASATDVSGQTRSEAGIPDPTEISAFTKDLEMESQDTTIDVERSDDDLHREMDIDLTDAMSSPTDGWRGSPPVIEPNHQGSHGQPSPLFTPECTPEVFSSLPLFLPDSEEDKNPIHLVRHATFAKDLISKDYHVYDNHYERHIITTVVWVSGDSRTRWNDQG